MFWSMLSAIDKLCMADADDQLKNIFKYSIAVGTKLENRQWIYSWTNRVAVM